MAIKDVLVRLDRNSDAAGAYAVSLASAFEAHLTAATLVFDPTPSTALPDPSGTLLTSAIEEARAAGREVLAGFAAQAQGSGITIDTELIEAVVGITGQAIGPFARHFDLTVVEQPNPDTAGDRQSMVEGALFGSGRPMLVVPCIQMAPLRLETVLIAWDGSATAARALADAMPFLERAKHVQVLTVVDPGDEAETSARRIIPTALIADL